MLDSEESRLGVTGPIALLLLLAGAAVADAIPPGGEAGGALVCCVPSVSRKSAKGWEFTCRPTVLADGRVVGSAGIALKSDAKLGALGTTALPGDNYPPSTCNLRASGGRPEESYVTSMG